MYRDFFKPLFDLLFSIILFSLLSPLFILLSMILSIANGGSPFFFQQRPGKKNKIFSVIKFKTMTDEKDKHGNLLPEVQRLHKLGKLVRKASLDEIPQLLNVIKGDMSLIGPRPLLVQYLPLYSKRQLRRHEVKPGITGWAQVNGRNAIGWQQKFEYDVWYIDNLSFLLDLKIILLTIYKVFKTEGVNQVGHTGMEKFTGTN